MIVLASALGCALPAHRPGFVFSLAVPGDLYDHVVWVAPVSIDEPTLLDRRGHEVAFTYNLARYLREREMFERVRIAPGSLKAEDWILELTIARQREEVVTYGPAVLLSVITFGLYRALGKLQVLEVEFEATLEIKDAQGRSVASATRSHTRSFDVYQRNAANAVSFFLDERRGFIDELFDEALEGTL